MSKIVIGSIVRNRESILPKYLECIRDLDYNKSDISLCFLVNDSTDNSYFILKDFVDGHTEYKNSIVKIGSYGYPEDNRDVGRGYDTFKQFAFLRNKWLDLIVDKFYNSEYVFSIDSDILVPSNSLNKLIENDKDMCSMLVNNSVNQQGYGKDYMNILKFEMDSSSKYKHIMEYPKDKVFKVDVTGACCLIKRKVLDTSRYRSHALGEDVGFCEEVKRNGYTIWCDSTLTGDHRMTLGGIEAVN